MELWNCWQEFIDHREQHLRVLAGVGADGRSDEGDDFWTKDAVLAAWAPLSPDEIMLDILASEEMVIMKRKFSARDLYVT